MKIQVDLDAELWARFREKVHGENKTLAEVVPYVFEPAIMTYLNPPPQFQQFIAPAALPLKRCEACDSMVNRLHAFEGKRVCYACWKGELTKERELVVVSKSDPSEAPTSVSSTS